MRILLLLGCFYFLVNASNFEERLEQRLPLTIEDIAMLSTRRSNYFGKVNEEDKDFDAKYEEMCLKYATFEDKGIRVKNEYIVRFSAYTPINLKENERVPAVIHVHGGPRHYFTKRTLQVELLYWISRRYIVVAPNYRGSKPEDKEPTWTAAASDVYEVSKYIIQTKFASNIDKTKVFLTGNSWGASVVGKLLLHLYDPLKTSLDYRKQNDKHYENLFSRVHMIAGIYDKGAEGFSLSQLGSRTIEPYLNLMVSHGYKDTVAPIDSAVKFIRGLSSNSGELRKRLILYFNENASHHMTSKDGITSLITKKLPDPVFEDYFRNVVLFVFVESMFSNIIEYSPRKNQILLQNIQDWKKRKEEQDKLAKSFVNADSMRFVSKFEKLETSASLNYAKFVLAGGHDSSLIAPVFIDEIYANMANLIRNRDDAQFYVRRNKDLAEKLKTAKDIGEFKELTKTAIKEDYVFKYQMQMFLDQEIFDTAHNPNQFTLYHGASKMSTVIYFFYNIFKKLFQGKTKLEDLTTLTHLRFFDQSIEEFPDVHQFLELMNRKRMFFKDEEFNNIPGYSDIALSFNMFLFGGHKTSFQFTPDYFFSSGIGKSQNFMSFISDVLKMYGMNDETRLIKYVNLLGDNDTEPIMISLTVDQKYLDKYGYVAEMFGEPVLMDFENSPEPSFAPSNFIKEARNSIEKLELHLQNRRFRFHNPGKLVDYGDVKNGFTYISQLQVRLILHPEMMNNPATKIRYHLRNPQSAFLNVLAHFILEDVSFILVGNSFLASNWLVDLGSDYNGALFGMDLSARHVGNLSDGQLEMIVKYDDIKAFRYLSNSTPLIKSNGKEIFEMLKKFRPRKIIMFVFKYYSDILEMTEETVENLLLMSILEDDAEFFNDLLEFYKKSFDLQAFFERDIAIKGIHPTNISKNIYNLDVGMKPFHCAIAFKSPKIVKFLMGHSMSQKIDFRVQKMGDYFPCELAVFFNSPMDTIINLCDSKTFSNPVFKVSDKDTGVETSETILEFATDSRKLTVLTFLFGFYELELERDSEIVEKLSKFLNDTKHGLINGNTDLKTRAIYKSFATRISQMKWFKEHNEKLEEKIDLAPFFQ